MGAFFIWANFYGSYYRIQKWGIGGGTKNKNTKRYEKCFPYWEKYIILKIVKKLTNTEDTMKDYIIGIDIGGTSVKLGLFTIEGELVHKWEVVTDKSNNGSNILNDICKSVKETLEEQQIPIDNVQGAGMGIPGPARSDGYVETCPNLGWRNCNPAKELSELLQIPVFVGNDANVAALGELWKGGGKGADTMVLITLGTGVGSGIIMNGEIVAGNRGLSGELGHVTVNIEEKEACNCNNYGCLEQYASATGIVRVANRMLNASQKPSKLREFDTLTAKDIFDCAKEYDEVAMEAVEKLGEYLGRTMASVTFTIDPDVFVIGGGVSKAGEILLNVINKYYKRYVCLSSQMGEVRLATLGNDAGIYGAAKMALGK